MTQPVTAARAAAMLIEQFDRQGWASTELPIVERSRLIPASLDFFRRPCAEKETHISGLTGYTPYGAEHGGDPSRPDMLESYVICLDASEKGEDQELDRALRAIRDDLRRLLWTTVAELIQSVTTDRDGLRASDFEAYVQVNYFPPTARIPVTAAGDMRMAAHEDPGLVTVFPCSASRDLEYRAFDGSWQAFPSGDTVPVFPGLLLSRLTDDRVPALVHRVRLPEDQQQERVSIAMTAWPRREARLSTLSRYRRPHSAPWSSTGSRWMGDFLHAYMAGEGFRQY